MKEYQLIKSGYFGKEKLLLYSGQFTLFDISSHTSSLLEGEINMSIESELEINFNGIFMSPSDAAFSLNTTELTITTPTGLAGYAFVGRRTMGSVNKVEGTINKLSAGESTELIDKYTVHVANFETIVHGFMVSFENWRFSSHIPIEIGDWRVDLQNGFDLEKKEEVKNSKKKQNYSLTNIIEIRKIDNSLFTSEEAFPIIETISAGFSLCSGRKIGFPIHWGFLKNEQKFEQFWHVYVDRYKAKKTWFPEYRPEILMSLLPLLHEKFESPYLKRAITRSIHLFTEADQTTFAGQPVLYTQVALETVWWLVLTQMKESSLSNKEYEDLRFAFKRMQEMAKKLKIDTNLPNFETLKLEETDIRDFPVLFTRYRNHLSHPSPNPIFDSINGWDEWKIAHWGLWYLEMGLLFVIGYDGEYADRRNIRRAAGIYEEVPWSKNSVKDIE